MELGGLQSIGSQRVGHDPSDLAAHVRLYLDKKRMGVRRGKTHCLQEIYTIFDIEHTQSKMCK